MADSVQTDGTDASGSSTPFQIKIRVTRLTTLSLVAALVMHIRMTNAMFPSRGNPTPHGIINETHSIEPPLPQGGVRRVVGCSPTETSGAPTDGSPQPRMSTPPPCSPQPRMSTPPPCSQQPRMSIETDELAFLHREQPLLQLCERTALCTLKVQL